MLKNYFITAWRNLLRNRFYSALNITGLAIGLAVGILILLWVRHELSYDKFHSRASDIYKINSHLGAGNDEQIWEGSPAPLAVMSGKVPEIESCTRITDNYHNTLFTYKEKAFAAEKSVYADSTFFRMFDFELINGDKNKPFNDNYSVVISSGTARKFFGDEDPVGKVLVADKTDHFTVTGVMQDFPQNSTLQYEMIFPMSLYAKRFRGNGEWKTINEDVGNYNFRIFFLLKPGADAKVAATKLSKVYETARGNEPEGRTFSMQSLTSLHLYGADGNASSIQTVGIFMLVAVFILIIACINYVNLSTARSIVRSKEVSLRKIIGADRRQLFIQFVLESALLFLLSSVLAFFLIKLLLPLYNNASGKELVFSFYDADIWMIISIVIVGCLALASIYPAILLSSFRPVEALKGKLTRGVGNAGFRRVLVVTQFVFSVTLIISTLVVGLQLKYINEKDLGFDREHVFTFRMRPEMENHSDAVRNELLKTNGVKSVSISMQNIVGNMASTGDTEWDGKEKNRAFIINANGIDDQFIPLFDIEVSEGRNFRGRSDSASLILNEAAVREAGIKDPVGKRFSLWSRWGTIVGVVKDFNYASLKHKVDPAVFFYQPSNSAVFVKTTGKDAAKVIESAQNLWNKYSAEYPFTYSFVDDDYDRLYKAEQRTSVLFNAFSIIAICISCLGLLGLATYTARVKKKEVGIRKVLGASISNITTLLAKDFFSLVVIALLISIPAAWFGMSKWLEDYAYRINLSWWIFVAGGIISLLIALCTVCMQAIRAALANPVNSLREE